MWEHLTAADLEALGLEVGQALASESTIRRVFHLSCTGWGGLCFRVGFFVGILGVGWSFRGTKGPVGSGG